MPLSNQSLDTPQDPARLTLEWSGMTHPGRHRKNNEDAFMALILEGHQMRYLGKIGSASLANADFVFAVCDGMGGQNLGEFASRRAADKLTTILPASFQLMARGMDAGHPDLLLEAFQEIHKDLLVFGATYPECRGMGTTLSLCWFTPGWMHFGHVGDSRIYYLPKGGALKQLTHDHTQVGWMRRTGRITEREARNHPGRSSLQQALGAGHQYIDPQLGAVRYEPGDRFLLCTDGLVDGLWDHRIAEYLARDDIPFSELA
ncbi:MAG: serine/threonine-protein phosphatase, partial [Verrucomicrobia bacterium]